jgi:hypothetical protein
MNWRRVEESFRGLIAIIFKCLSKRTEENYKILSHDSRNYGRYSSRLPFLYKSREAPLYQTTRCDHRIASSYKHQQRFQKRNCGANSWQSLSLCINFRLPFPEYRGWRRTACQAGAVWSNQFVSIIIECPSVSLTPRVAYECWQIIRLMFLCTS